MAAIAQTNTAATGRTNMVAIRGVDVTKKAAKYGCFLGEDA